MNLNLQTQTLGSTSTTKTILNLLGTIPHQLFLALVLFLMFSANGYANSNIANKDYTETYTTKKLTIKNNGSCTVRVYHWLASGDVFKKKLAAGDSWSVDTEKGQMWRVINTSFDWQNLEYDEHYTVGSNDTQTWKITPDYCEDPTKKLTIKNNGSCTVRVYHWLESGDVFKKELKAGESCSVDTEEGQMWRVINTNQNWNDLEYDEHYTVGNDDTQTWKITPDYCEDTCDEKAKSLSFVSGTKTLDIAEGQKLCAEDFDFSSSFLRVNVSGDIGSIKIWIEGPVESNNLENYAPYDSKTLNFVAGKYVVKTKIYSESKQGGTVCSENEFTFEIEDCEETTCDGKSRSLSFMSADGKEKVRITNGGKVCIEDIDFSNGFLRVSTKGDVGSMKIWIKGAITDTNAENYAPYDTRPFDIVAGTYEVKTRIFSESKTNGVICSEKEFTFEVEDCNTDECDIVTVDGGSISAGTCDDGTLVIKNTGAPIASNGMPVEVVWIRSEGEFSACQDLGQLGVDGINVGAAYDEFIAAGGFGSNADPSVPGTTSWEFVADDNTNDLQLTVVDGKKACYLRCARIVDCGDRFLGETDPVGVESDCFPDVINDCTPVEITAGAGTVTVTNLNAPLTQVLVLTPDYATTIDNCTNCDPTQVFSNVPAGDYIVVAKLLDASYALICEKVETVTVTKGLDSSTNYANKSRVATINTNTTTSNSINVFPNPAVDELNVDLSSLAGQNGMIQIHNQMGQLVQTVVLDQINSTSVAIKLNQAPSGIYLVTIVADGQLVGSEKVMVK